MGGRCKRLVGLEEYRQECLSYVAKHSRTCTSLLCSWGMNFRLAIVTLAAFAIGCNSTEPSTDSGYRLTGNVVLFDSLGMIIDNPRGVTVAAGGKSFTTDTSGVWDISVAVDNYSLLSFTKPGFETRYMQLPPGPVHTSTLYLAKRPAFPVALDAAAIAESDIPGVDAGFIVYGHYPSAPSGALAWNIRVLLSRKKTYDPNDSTAVEAFYEPPFVEKNGDTTNYSFYIGYNEITQFKSGDSIYIRAYPKGYVSTYIDPDEAHEDIFPYGTASDALVVVRQ